MYEVHFHSLGQLGPQHLKLFNLHFYSPRQTCSMPLVCLILILLFWCITSCACSVKTIIKSFLNVFDRDKRES